MPPLAIMIVLSLAAADADAGSAPAHVLNADSSRALQPAAVQPSESLPVWLEKDTDGPAMQSPGRHEGQDAGDAAPLKLSPRGSTTNRDPSAPIAPTRSRSIVTVVASLAIVLGTFFLIVWITRRGVPQGLQPLSKEVIQVLGRAPLAGRQQMHLVQVGNKLLLVSVTPTGAETLTEITDAVEVDRLAALCRKDQPGSVTATFRHVLGQLGSERNAGGFIGDGPQDDLDIANAPARRTGRYVTEDRHV